MAWLILIVICFILSKVENEKFFIMGKILLKNFFQIMTIQLFNFGGRSARRSFYINSVFIAALLPGRIIALALAESILSNTLNILIIIALFISYASLAVRRMHDAGFRGWWLIPCIFFPVLLVPFVLIPGTPGTNRFGPNPRNKHYGYLT